MNNRNLKRKISFALLLSGAIFQAYAVKTSAQITQVSVPRNQAQDDFTWWYVTLFFLIAGLSSAVVWWFKSKSAEKAVEEKKIKSAQKKEDYWETGSLDADKEMEWLRKNQNILDSSHKKRKLKKAPFPQKPNVVELSENEALTDDKNLQIVLDINAPLPIFGFYELLPSKSFSPLPISNNEDLLGAIEQTQEEDEEDEQVRELAVRILAAFKNRNSVEALSQVAVYDLSASLRSKAVTTLAEFDHESVFETILVGCADPSREVRAAAARGLSRLSFDRADAWTRITESGEEGRMKHAARAAIEGGFVGRSFERLAHADRKQAYEAFTLLALLIKAAEIKVIIEALRNNQDENVRLALLHLIKVIKDQNSLDSLYNLLEDKKLPAEIKGEIGKTIEEVGFVMA